MILLHPVLKIKSVHIHFFIALLGSKKCSYMSPIFFLMPSSAWPDVRRVLSSLRNSFVLMTLEI